MTQNINSIAWDINERWNKATSSILSVCELCHRYSTTLNLQQKAELLKLLNFSRSVFSKLAAIGADKRLFVDSLQSKLPANYTILYELTKLDTVQLANAVAKDAIKPDMRRTEAGALRARPVVEYKTALDREPVAKAQLLLAPPTTSRAAAGLEPAAAPLPDGDQLDQELQDVEDWQNYLRVHPAYRELQAKARTVAGEDKPFNPLDEHVDVDVNFYLHQSKEKALREKMLGIPSTEDAKPFREQAASADPGSAAIVALIRIERSRFPFECGDLCSDLKALQVKHDFVLQIIGEASVEPIVTEAISHALEWSTTYNTKNEYKKRLARLK